ncbi:MAG: hypothetical protein H8E12_20660 [Rhodobacteraceae bacterium]|nr:hypothetical protein [Paracoccaceae bacterium]
MASLISSGEKAELTGVFGDVFDTFSRNIIVYKEPIKTVSSINEANIFGYGDTSNQVNYSYTAQSGTYPATVQYADHQQQKYSSDVGGAIPQGQVRIKVRPDCRDFIKNGRTERIEFDDKSWDLVSDDTAKKFLDSEYYVYHLERRK